MATQLSPLFAPRWSAFNNTTDDRATHRPIILQNYLPRRVGSGSGSREWHYQGWCQKKAFTRAISCRTSYLQARYEVMHTSSMASRTSPETKDLFHDDLDISNLVDAIIYLRQARRDIPVAICVQMRHGRSKGCDCAGQCQPRERSRASVWCRGCVDSKNYQSL